MIWRRAIDKLLSAALPWLSLIGWAQLSIEDLLGK